MARRLFYEQHGLIYEYLHILQNDSDKIRVRTRRGIGKLEENNRYNDYIEWWYVIADRRVVGGHCPLLSDLGLGHLSANHHLRAGRPFQGE